MRGIDAGPGTDLGGLAWFIGMWVTMIAAMMLSSAAPWCCSSTSLDRDRPARQTAVPTWMFCLSYLAVWTLYGLAAYGLYRLIVRFDFGFLEWDSGGRYVAGAAIAAAGLYELTPLKSERPSATVGRRCTSSWATGGRGGSAPYGWAWSTAHTASGVAGASWSSCSRSAS